MRANSGIYLGPLSPIEKDELWHEGPPLLVDAGTFGIDQQRGARHGVHMRKAHAGFCPMAKDGHAHWYVGFGKKCIVCKYNRNELTDRQKAKAERAKTLTEATQQMQAAVGDFSVAIGNAGISFEQAAKSMNQFGRTRSHGPR